MITTVIVLACVGAYFAVGALYARSQAVACHRRAIDQWGSYRSAGDRVVVESVRMQQLWRIPAWPYAVVFDAVRGGVNGWLAAPLDDRREQAAALRAEADRYDALIAGCADPLDRDLMRRGQQALRDQAKELDL